MRVIFSWVISFGILEFITILLVSVNLLTFLLYVVDKRKAKRGKWRISEATLIFFTLAFGGFGAFLGMRFAHGFALSADGAPVYTSSGIGVYYNIPRIFARPEVVIFTMYTKYP